MQISKEQCLRYAKLEGDSEIGAGLLARDPTFPPAEFDAIADVVLAYRPKPKSKPAKKRKRRAKKLSRAQPMKEPDHE
jgi:hypothetical protein